MNVDALHLRLSKVQHGNSVNKITINNHNSDEGPHNKRCSDYSLSCEQLARDL